MKLYEIDNAILGCVDADTGEVVDVEMLEALEMERDAKIENIALWIKDLNAEALALKTEKESFDKRKKAVETKAESLKRFLTNYLDGTDFETTKCKISWRKSTSVEIEDVYELPTEFLKIPMPEANKTAIKDALKSGEKIIGCQLVENKNIQIK